ncbi:hypothetical protein CTATCC11996_06958 [Comamonas testosteroni ATCC 11996]|nr:hypothetical protein CTATCC11996_06958 [Comamonas testosteroni ATCC 11996]
MLVIERKASGGQVAYAPPLICPRQAWTPCNLWIAGLNGGLGRANIDTAKGFA